MTRFISIALGFALTATSLLALASAAHAQAGQWGNVKGAIVWGGKEIPKQAPVDMKAHQDMAACTLNGNVVISEEWVVNPKNKGLKWTFVWLTHVDTDNKKPLPMHPDLKEPKSAKVVMDQPLCAFTPHGLAMRQGQILVAKNSAGIAHNFKWTGDTVDNPGNNVLVAAGGAIEIKNLQASSRPIKIECSIHTWMHGWVRVYNHPYYAVTDKDGAFELKNAPAGKFRLIAWHGSGGWLGGAAGKDGRIVTISADKTTDVGNLVYTP